VALLASRRVVPRVLREYGFSFRFPDLEGALRFMLGKSLE
jgi:NAD dependent epimerase/dehydratase family enzyme